MHDVGPVAMSDLWLQEGDQWIPVGVEIGRPMESPDSLWLAQVKLTLQRLLLPGRAAAHPGHERPPACGRGRQAPASDVTRLAA